MSMLRALAAVFVVFVVADVRAEEPCPEPSGDASADEDSARRMFDSGLALEPSDPQGALVELHCAQKHADKPAIALRIGTIAERLGNRREAITAFEHYLELAGDSAPDRRQLSARIATLRGELEGERSKPVKRDAPPIEEGDQGIFVAGWVLTGAGLVLAIAGGVLLSVAKEQNDEVEALQPGTVAWDSDEARGTFEAAERNQALGIVGLAVGGAMMVGGVVMSVLSRPRVRAAVTTGPGLVVRLSF